MTEAQRTVILVAGDVCLDVAGIPVPGSSSGNIETDNWRQTGEICTHYQPGGAFQLTEFMRVANPDGDVSGPIPCLPAALSCTETPDQPMNMDEFRAVSERLTKDEIIISKLDLDLFKATHEAKKADTIRLVKTNGFSGPKDGDPSMKILPPDNPVDAKRCLVILDDTGNQFRRSPEQWPAIIEKPGKDSSPLVIYKLHRPLPNGNHANPLWEVVKEKHAQRCVVTVSVDDLRDRDASISQGLSWERTALDLVWQLLHTEAFASFRDCPHLVVRLGLDGALYWHCEPGEDGLSYSAWLVYDPVGIEGTGLSAFPGQMVGYASAFTAGLASQLVKAAEDEALEFARGEENKPVGLPKAIEAGIKNGLAASRRLLELGFGMKDCSPQYPGAELFDIPEKKKPFFACQPVPIIPGAAVPDRGYWRLLESIFAGKATLLQRAVAMTATGLKPVDSIDIEADNLLQQVPVAVFAKALRAVDRSEIENYRALYSLLRDYVGMSNALRPLSVAVFGPPGAGKSFGVKKVAESLGQIGDGRPIKSLTFNLSQYQKADDLAEAFHLVRDCILAGFIPLVFFDEFDTSLDGKPLGWLRYFLAPMQDGEFLDRGTPHPIGQAIFVFAGGTCESYADFAKPFFDPRSDEEKSKSFKNAKGPDFLSRLRATLDIPGLNLDAKVDPFGPTSSFPSEPAILLRRAAIFAYQLGQKAPQLRDPSGMLRISPSVMRVLLHLPQFVHGNRSFEAMLDMSHFQGASKFTPALLPASGHTALHANASHLEQLLATDYPFPLKDRTCIAQEIHRAYQEQRRSEDDYDPNDPSCREWDELSTDESGRKLQLSNLEQADHLAIKLRIAGLWIRKMIPGAPPDPAADQRLETMLELLARLEHDRWVIEKRKQGWIAAANTNRESRNNKYLLHNALFPWEELPEEIKELDREPIRKIPHFLAMADYEIFKA